MDASRDESMVAAIATALEPYPWRRFTPEQLARRALAARDRQGLADLLDSLPGIAAGPWPEQEPVAHDDPRLPVLVDFLAAHRWTQFSLVALSRQLVAVLYDAA